MIKSSRSQNIIIQLLYIILGVVLRNGKNNGDAILKCNRKCVTRVNPKDRANTSSQQF